MGILPAGERRALFDHMVEVGIAGDTRTPRANVLAHAAKLAADDPDKMLGLDPVGLSAEQVMEAVAALCGCSPHLAERDGPGVIDPARTLAQLDACAERLALAAARGEGVLICTGHPAGLLPLYQRIAAALEAGGAKLITPLENEILGTAPGGRGWRVRYLAGVGNACDGASLLHTHEGWLMDALLDSGETPDLVLADHGFAGTAIRREIETLAFTDVNDPALAVAWRRGLTKVVVPLDDNLPPRLYEPLARAVAGAIAARSADR